MSKKEPRKESGGKLFRTETVTVRLDPKLRYLADLASRKQRRTLSSFIEWAIEDSLRSVELYHGTGYSGDNSLSVHDEIYRLWDVDEADRFCKLAQSYPELLTHDEQRLWKLISEFKIVIAGEKDEQSWGLFLDDAPILPAIREIWPQLWSCINGEISKPELVKVIQQNVEPLAYWIKRQPNKANSVDDFDDIPF